MTQDKPSSTLERQERNFHGPYRPDIDGLRALAILPVVAFHAFPDWVSGGFIGVDVFFVISGFLISTILFKSLARGSFSFAEFYTHRIRRIFPALILVTAFCFAFGWFVLLPEEYKRLGKHITAGAGFVENLVLSAEAGYFDVASELKPLMHLWSLAIEEQFYLIFPFILWGAWKLRLNLSYLVGAICVVSFGTNIIGTHEAAAKTFFAPQARFWELMVGALLASLMLHNIAMQRFASVKHFMQKMLTFQFKTIRVGCTADSLLSLAGLGLILASVFLLDKTSPYPGGRALFPVAGTALLILTGPQAWVNRAILANRTAVFIGVISYPLYLWHWPLLSFSRILESQTPALTTRLSLVALSFLFAALTYWLLEKTVRYGGYGRLKVAALIALTIAVGCTGKMCEFLNGLSFRAVAHINMASGRDGGDQNNTARGCGIEDERLQDLFGSCSKDKRDEPVYALLGDSKASALFWGLVRTSIDKHRWLFIGGNGKNALSVPVISKDPLYESSQRLTSIANAAIVRNDNIKVVVLATATRALFGLRNSHSIDDLPASNRYEIALDGLSHEIEAITGAGKKVVLVVDNPTLLPPEDCLQRRTSLEWLNSFLGLPKSAPSGCAISITQHIELSGKYRKLLRAVQAKFPGKVVIFDTIPYMCEASLDLCQSSKNGRLMYSYSDHISDYAAGLIGRALNTYLDSILLSSTPDKSDTLIERVRAGGTG